MKGFLGIASATLLLLVLCGGSAVPTTALYPERPVQEEFEPIDNMHHFMEYISQPAYLALKDALAAEPADRKAMKVVKSHALTLAENECPRCRAGPG